MTDHGCHCPRSLDLLGLTYITSSIGLGMYAGIRSESRFHKLKLSVSLGCKPFDIEPSRKPEAREPRMRGKHHDHHWSPPSEAFILLSIGELCVTLLPNQMTDGSDAHLVDPGDDHSHRLRCLVHHVCRKHFAYNSLGKIGSINPPKTPQTFIAQALASACL